jgi:hypothetical protein
MNRSQILLGVLVLAAVTVSAQPEKKDDKTADPTFKGLHDRSIGPFRVGRSLTVAGIPGDINTYYFGSVGGGIWKTTDGAMTWSPVFD